MRYIGSKRKLLDNIKNIINDNIKNNNVKVFCDIFAGTGIVSENFKTNFKIISNDIMYYSYVILKGKIANNRIPKFKDLYNKYNIKDVTKFLNNLEPEYNEKTYFVTNNYTPKKSNRMYFTIENGMKIDVIRQQIEKWYQNKDINENEYFYLLMLLIEAIPYVSNITGTYGAFLKKWDNRALKTLELKYIDIIDNNRNNEVYNEDSNKLIEKISGDLLYIDPPYTSVDYSTSYHVLETIAKYDYPELKGVTGQRVNNNKRSKYTKKQLAREMLEELIKKANFKYILISYSNHGIIKEEELLSIVDKYKKKFGLSIFNKIKYREYKNINSAKNKEPLYEFLILFEKDNNV